MAKRANKVQETGVIEQQVLDGQVDQDVIDLEREVVDVINAVEVDANGRKKKVNLSYEELEAQGLKNKSQIIRYLDANGYSRSAIALFLNIRYQFVRNVLVTPLKKG